MVSKKEARGFGCCERMFEQISGKIVICLFSLDFNALSDKCGYHKTKRLTLKESVFKIVLEICKKVV